MDSCNIQLKELKVYVNGETHMWQFLNLERLKQSKIVNTLVIIDKVATWNQDHLVYFLQSLSKDNDCQLKEYVFDSFSCFKDNNAKLVFLMHTPIQILNDILSFQRLDIRWIDSKELLDIPCSQATHLAHLEMTVLEWHDHEYSWDKSIEHIQTILYTSPLLQ
jgi:hypothetical protein